MYLTVPLKSVGSCGMMPRWDRSKIMKTNCGDVKAIYNDFPLCWFHHSKQTTDKCCLSTTSPTNDPDFVSSFNEAAYSLENKWSIGLISHLFDVI